jgi:hypothetical protein
MTIHEENPALYAVARRVCHSLGLPWTDPRNGVTYLPPPQPCACDLDILRRVERAEVDEADPVKHTAFYLLGCPTCRDVVAFPIQNLELTTARYRAALRAELARDGWNLNEDGGGR